MKSLRTIEHEYKNPWLTTDIPYNGTDASQFNPQIDKNVSVYAFVEDLQRSVELEFFQETSYAGLPVYEYRLNRESMMISPDNE